MCRAYSFNVKLEQQLDLKNKYLRHYNKVKNLKEYCTRESSWQFAINFIHSHTYIEQQWRIEIKFELWKYTPNYH